MNIQDDKTYIQDNMTIHNADCMTIMAAYEDNYFDLAVVDPPFGINIAKWDSSIPTVEYFNELKRVSKNYIIWGGNYFASILGNTEAIICWYKRPFLKGQAHFELAYTSFKMKPILFDYMYAGNCEGTINTKVDYKKKSIHECQKPIALYNWIYANYAGEGQKILDTHLGSGSNAIAAHYAKMNFVGCELDEDYYNASIDRIRKETRQLELF